jgi:hypothetical protein
VRLRRSGGEGDREVGLTGASWRKSHGSRSSPRRMEASTLGVQDGEYGLA